MKKAMELWENAVEKMKIVEYQERYWNYKKILDKWRPQLENKRPIHHEELVDFGILLMGKRPS